MSVHYYLTPARLFWNLAFYFAIFSLVLAIMANS